MSLDVSPDGRAIVFDLLGDLYTMPIAGGAATRLTSGMALNREPRFAPNGREIAFVSDRSGSENLWIIDRDGRDPRQISDLRGSDAFGAITSPAWAPDGRAIIVSQRLGAAANAVVKGAMSRLWLLAAYDVRSHKMQWLSDTVAAHARSALGPTFDVRRRALYAAVLSAPLDATVVLGNWRIARIDSTGRVFPEMGGGAGRIGVRPLVSPNARYLVYGSSSGSHVGLRLRDLTTDEERWLVRERLDDPSGSEQVDARDLLPGYSFTPDSKSLVVAYGGRIHRIDIATSHATIIPFVANVVRSLGPLTVYQFGLPDTGERTRAVMQPALSPNGRWVAFTAVDRIWVMELPHDGLPAGRPRRLTADSIGEFYPTWSPDGQWLAYATWRDGEGGGLWRTKASLGGEAAFAWPKRLSSDSALYFYPAISSDGERVAAVRIDQPSDGSLTNPIMLNPLNVPAPTLVWVPAQGGRPRTVVSLRAASDEADLDYPVHQVYTINDNHRIYVGLTSWRWDGSDERKAFAVRNDDVAGVLSPDGRRAFVSRGGTALYEVSVPASVSAKLDTLDLGQPPAQHFAGSVLAAKRWGTALAPSVSWSRDGQRVVFSQGGTLYVGDVRSTDWTGMDRVEVPLTIAPDIPGGSIVLRGARIATMAKEGVIERGDIVVQGNRITGVGPTGRVPIPSDAKVLDITGRTVLPGYVDIHDHHVMPTGIHVGQYWKVLLEVAYGITAMRDPFALRTNDIFMYAERERMGQFIAPRLFSTGVPYLGTDPPIHNLSDARDFVRVHAHDFRTETFKIYYDQATDRRTRQLLAMATREMNLNATVHTNGLDQVLASVIDGLSGIEHWPSIATYDDVATLLARSGTTEDHTFLATTWGSMAYMTRRYGWPLERSKVRRFVPPSAREATCGGCAGEDTPAYGPIEVGKLRPLVSGAARIVARGGRVAMGSHGNISGIGFHYEMWLHALGGMPNLEILRSATIVGATAIGHARDLGSIEPGKLADLQILADDPLKDIHNTTSIRYVMKNGRLYSADDLSEIWPRSEPLASIYLWKDSSSVGLAGARRHRRAAKE